MAAVLAIAYGNGNLLVLVLPIAFVFTPQGRVALPAAVVVMLVG